MKMLWLLLKTNIINSLKLNKILKTSKMKLVMYSLVVIGLSASFFVSIFLSAIEVVAFFHQYNLTNLMLVVFFVMASFITFFFTIYNAKGSLFNANDNNMLLSMPIKSSVILASRLISLIIFNLLTILIFMVPVIIAYITKFNVGFHDYLFIFTIFILLPIIPTILASLFGYLVAYIASKSNNKSMIELLMSFLFIIVFVYISNSSNQILTYIIKNLNSLENIIKWSFYPIYLVYKAFMEYDYLSLILYIVINISLFLIFITILSKSFKKIIAKLHESKTKSNYQMKHLKASSIKKTLLIKEIKRYFSSPIYLLNTSFGVLMFIVFALSSIFFAKEQLLEFLDLSANGITSFQIVLLGVAFITFISITTSSSISLEGKNFWLLKTLPIAPKQIISAKVGLNLLVVLPLTLLAIIMFKFTLLLTIIEVLIIMLVAILFTICAAQFGLLINLKFPKMDASSDTAVVKRSTSSVISLFVPIVLIIILINVYAQLSNNINFNMFLSIIMVFVFIIIIIEKIILNTWGVKRIKKIN